MNNRSLQPSDDVCINANGEVWKPRNLDSQAIGPSGVLQLTSGLYWSAERLSSNRFSRTVRCTHLHHRRQASKSLTSSCKWRPTCSGLAELNRSTSPESYSSAKVTSTARCVSKISGLTFTNPLQIPLIASPKKVLSTSYYRLRRLKVRVAATEMPQF